MGNNVAFVFGEYKNIGHIDVLYWDANDHEFRALKCQSNGYFINSYFSFQNTLFLCSFFVVRFFAAVGL